MRGRNANGLGRMTKIEKVRKPFVLLRQTHPAPETRHPTLHSPRLGGGSAPDDSFDYTISKPLVRTGPTRFSPMYREASLCDLSRIGPAGVLITPSNYIFIDLCLVLTHCVYCLEVKKYVYICV